MATKRLSKEDKVFYSVVDIRKNMLVLLFIILSKTKIWEKYIDWMMMIIMMIMNHTQFVRWQWHCYNG